MIMLLCTTYVDHPGRQLCLPVRDDDRGARPSLDVTDSSPVIRIQDVKVRHWCEKRSRTGTPTTVTGKVIAKLEERQGLHASRLDSLNTGIAIHLPVEGIDLRHAELPCEGKMVAVHEREW